MNKEWGEEWRLKITFILLLTAKLCAELYARRKEEIKGGCNVRKEDKRANESRTEDKTGQQRGSSIEVLYDAQVLSSTLGWFSQQLAKDAFYGGEINVYKGELYD